MTHTNNVRASYDLKQDELQMYRKIPTILYVDDDKQALRTLSRHTRNKPWRIVTATSAEEAMELVVKEDFSIELAVLDLAMPEMDGFELLRSLRFFDPTLPVMILTGCVENKNFFKALDLGCDGFIEKPYDANALLMMMSTLLPLRTRTQLEDRQVLRQRQVQPEQYQENTDYE